VAPSRSLCSSVHEELAGLSIIVQKADAAIERKIRQRCVSETFSGFDKKTDSKKRARRGHVYYNKFK
jgi:hypothetical protein